MGKINLTRVFLSSLPVDTRLSFGVSKNVKLTNIFNGEKTDRKGQIIKKNRFVTFAQYDKDDKVIADSTFSYFNFERPSFAKENFTHQLIQLTEIVTFCAPEDKSDEFVEQIGEYVNENIDDYDKIFNGTIDTEDIPHLTDTMSSFVDFIIELLGGNYADGEKVQLMLGCDKKTGKFVDLPKEDSGFIAENDAKALKTPVKYIKWRAKKDIPQTDSPDLVEDEAMVMDSTDVLAADEVDLDGI